MKVLFDQLSAQVSKATTKLYSTSFSLGIYFLDKDIRGSIYAIYGFVRLADEIVDSFHHYDRRRLLEQLKTDTWRAIAEGISVNPILNSFQLAVWKYRIDTHLIRVFFESMEMDLQPVTYGSEEYDKYIFGSAEVVGLMCLHVFTEGNTALYEELKPDAMKLGAAFQKVNFLRDMKDDYQLLGRIYFPGIDLGSFTAEAKERIEEDIRKDFDQALRGIRKLPASSKSGVYLAYVYYQSLFSKIRRLPPQRILAGRIRISNSRKLQLMVNSLMGYKFKRV
jgi:15-cis-phytoene synthase